MAAGLFLVMLYVKHSLEQSDTGGAGGGVFHLAESSR